MDEVAGYKVWRLRAGVEIGAVRRIVQEEIVPHYARLSEDVRLRLELVGDDSEDRPRVLAVQSWASQEARAGTFTGPAFDRWWREYLPVLARWDELVELQEEWDCERLV